MMSVSSGFWRASLGFISKFVLVESEDSALVETALHGEFLEKRLTRKI